MAKNRYWLYKQAWIACNMKTQSIITYGPAEQDQCLLYKHIIQWSMSLNTSRWWRIYWENFSKGLRING